MISLLLIGLTLATGQDQPSSQAEVRDVCSAQSGSQVAFGDCLEAHVAKSAALLVEAEKRAAARIDRWDEDARYRILAKAALTRSNAEFLRYRARECDFVGTLAGGSIGTAHDHWRLACTYELNVRRATSLAGFVVSLPQGEP